MSSAAHIYQGLPADERQEFRLPGLLKDHLTRAAAQSQQSVAEYITTTLAERVTHDLAAAIDWTLSVDEQTTLMKVLVAAAPRGPSARAKATAARAEALFGPLDPASDATK
jgi:hypothetical protein